MCFLRTKRIPTSDFFKNFELIVNEWQVTFTALQENGRPVLENRITYHKKVLLRERKRHTARHVAHTRTAVPAGGCGLTHKVKI